MATHENIGRGILFSLGAIPVGVVAYVVLWQTGFIAAISAYILGILAIKLYQKGAGAPPLKGQNYLIAVILVGLIISIAAGIGADAIKYYGEHNSEIQMTQSEFLVSALSTPDVWASYGKDIALSLVFAVLGLYGTFKSLWALKKASKKQTN